MKEIWIIGSGRFGLQAAERLDQTHSRHHLVLVDKDEKNLMQGRGPNRTLVKMDGVAFLECQLHRKAAPEWIIPALPIHLAARWCLMRKKPRGLRQIGVPSSVDLLVPNSTRDPAGNLYTSHADFICPDDCPEPAQMCSVTQKKRKADMFAVLGGIRLTGYRSLAVRSFQLGPGVGGYRPRQLLDLLDQIVEKEENYLLSTACRCHGVTTALTYSETGNPKLGI